RGPVLPAGAAIVDAGRLPAIEADGLDEGAGCDRQIRALKSACQIAPGNAPAPARAGRPVHGPEAFLLPAIGVGREGIARFLAGPDEGSGEGRGARGGRGDMEGALARMV